uniref:Uncharacterized protein n=1 Tax=Fagus sylvatica TaxID=28930 RepID=A0A2N9GKA2_FAGSY
MLPANRELHVVAGVVIFPTHPELAVQLAATPDVGFRRSWYRRKACAAYFCKVPGFVGNPSLGSRDMVPRTGAAGVFLVRLRDSFPIRIPARPGKSWRSESSTLCMNVSSFQRAQACGSTCCESGRLCAQAWQRRWERSGIFSTALFRQPVFTCVVDVAPDIGFSTILVSSESLCYLFSKGTGLAQRRAWVRKI